MDDVRAEIKASLYHKDLFPITNVHTEYIVYEVHVQQNFGLNLCKKKTNLIGVVLQGKF